eukprot:CAMPEP_0177774744 /NCGR_PEP_ID=MMETSP0491_2-20121128/13701_1 /TAXON_ID=63592 /ORGANISM="Tetraselmis chuii, Strain PLY429" /LENGTH=206 /DNA_ID=CAMNT_0019293205 /DNA_START=320 /DNA_END=940 /DNA_ORIENTATION=+
MPQHSRTSSHLTCCCRSSCRGKKVGARFSMDSRNEKSGWHLAAEYNTIRRLIELDSRCHGRSDVDVDDDLTAPAHPGDHAILPWQPLCHMDVGTLHPKETLLLNAGPAGHVGPMDYAGRQLVLSHNLGEHRLLIKTLDGVALISTDENAIRMVLIQRVTLLVVRCHYLSNLLDTQTPKLWKTQHLRKLHKTVWANMEPTLLRTVPQ